MRSRGSVCNVEFSTMRSECQHLVMPVPVQGKDAGHAALLRPVRTITGYCGLPYLAKANDSALKRSRGLDATTH